MREQEIHHKVVVQRLLGPRLTALYGEGAGIEQRVLDKIGATLVEVEANTEEEYIQAARDADALVAYGGGVRFTRGLIEALEKCRIIAVPAVGFDHVDVPAATEKGIVVTNVPDVFIEEVADHTMTLLLACWRRLITQDTIARTGRWIEARPMLYQFPRLLGQTLGFVAFGNIPRAVARRAKPFGLRMMAYDPHISELVMHDYGVEPREELSDLLESSDFVSVHLPLSSETYHMISEPQFRQMKPTAVFLSTGRGPTVDEAALIKALQEGWIAFAGLDVFEKEPLAPDSPIIKMDNVILTAHVASASSRMMPQTRRRAAQEVARVLQGWKPLHPVN